MALPTSTYISHGTTTACGASETPEIPSFCGSLLAILACDVGEAWHEEKNPMPSLCVTSNVSPFV